MSISRENFNGASLVSSSTSNHSLPEGASSISPIMSCPGGKSDSHNGAPAAPRIFASTAGAVHPRFGLGPGPNSVVPRSFRQGYSDPDPRTLQFYIPPLFRSISGERLRYKIEALDIRQHSRISYDCQRASLNPFRYRVRFGWNLSVVAREATQVPVESSDGSSETRSGLLVLNPKCGRPEIRSTCCLWPGDLCLH